MIAGVLIWGFGFTAINSLQQARLVLAAPALSAGAVALNTSMLYIARRSARPRRRSVRARPYVPIGYLATAIMVAGFGVLLTTRPREEARAGRKLCGRLP